jgi:hypothetical protein
LTTPALETRYLHIGGGFAAGGWFTGLGPNGDVNVPIPSVAPVHLPLVGGVSESKATKIVVDCSKVDFGKLDRATRADWKGRTLLTMGSGYAKVEAIPNAPGKPFQSRVVAEIKALKVDSFSLKQATLNMATWHDPAKDPQPKVTFGDTAILGLKLGRNELTITLDTATFNKYATMREFEAAFAAGQLPRTLVQTLAVDENGVLHRNSSMYVVGSLVKKIEGKLPDGATIDPNGYTITWPGFGKIILGEVTMGGFLRRASLLRLKHSDDEFCSGCSGGSYYP